MGWDRSVKPQLEQHQVRRKMELNTGAVQATSGTRQKKLGFECGARTLLWSVADKAVDRAARQGVISRMWRVCSTPNPTRLKNIFHRKQEWESGARVLVRLLANKAVDIVEKCRRVRQKKLAVECGARAVLRMIADKVVEVVAGKKELNYGATRLELRPVSFVNTSCSFSSKEKKQKSKLLLSTTNALNHPSNGKYEVGIITGIKKRKRQCDNLDDKRLKRQRACGEKMNSQGKITQYFLRTSTKPEGGETNFLLKDQH